MESEFSSLYLGRVSGFTSEKYEAESVHNEGGFTEAEIANEVCKLAGSRILRKTVKLALKMEPLIRGDKKTYPDLLSLPKRLYLDTVLVPALINGVMHVAIERSHCPIKSLAVYLLKHRTNYEKEAELETDVKFLGKSKSRIGSSVSSKMQT